MSEPTPPASSNTVIIALLLLVCGVLVYLDWRKSGEIENLHARIDGLAPPQPMRTPAAARPSVPPDFARAMESTAPDATVPPPYVPPLDPTLADEYVPGSVPTLPQQPAPVGPPEPHPLIRAVLQAHTDGELHTMGNEGT